MRRITPVLLLLFTLIGCGERVPVEVKTAMEKQAAELQQIRASYKSSVDALFAQIRLLQIAILAEKERQIRQKYTIGPKVIEGKVSYYDANGKPFPPTGDPSLDVLPTDKDKTISDFFDKLRADSEAQLQQTKEEFMKLDGHMEIAEQINTAVSDYITSLVNARNAQRELGNNLLSKLGAIPTGSNLPSKILNLLVPDTTTVENLPKSK
jgi:hypothetical protein